jgi:hypothetical protein
MVKVSELSEHAGHGTGKFETQVKSMDLNHKYVAQGNSTTFRARVEHRVYDGRSSGGTIESPVFLYLKYRHV